jgi:ATP-dependent helicase HrpA
VVDPGLARISRYASHSNVQRLPIEPISRASAEQRKGRCGRLEPGICVRLYSEEDFANRPPFTPPEILRTNLAAVILQMIALHLGEVDQFPFIEPPDGSAVRDGYRTLLELGAITPSGALTAIGRDLARLPTDPRIGRMILAARDEDCLDEVLVIAAALSVQDPRQRPMDEPQAADQAHARWKDPRSDFVGYLRLWRDWHQQQRRLSNRQFRNWCHAQFLSLLRLREWDDIHRQLRELAGELGLLHPRRSTGA